MSISAAIQIHFPKHNHALHSLRSLFRNFEIEGWNYVNSNGEITILPLGDNHRFNWTSVTLSRDSLFELMREKQERQEIIGIELLRADSEIGCELLISDSNHMMFSLSIARKKINTLGDHDITDFSWYLNSILPAFRGIQLEYIQCEQLL